MSLSLQQKQELLRSKGFDPSRFYMDEGSGDVFEGQDSSSPQIEEPVLPRVPTSPKSSATTVFAKSALREIGPTALSLGGGALAAEALPFAHVAPPYSEIAAGLIGALGTGFAAKKAQSALIPQETQAKIFPSALEEQEHPIASSLGGLAPSAAFFNPVKSVQSLARAGGTLGRRAAYGYAANTAEEIAALKQFGLNTGVNVGTQAGLNVAQQLQSDEPFSAGSLLGSAATGLLLNEPTRLGTKLFGFHPSYKDVPTQAEILAGRPGLADYTTEASVPHNLEPSALDIEAAAGAPYRPDLLAAQGKLPTNEPKHNVIKQLANPEKIVKPVATTELGKEFYPDYTGITEYENLQNKRAPLTEGEQIQRQYDEGKYSESPTQKLEVTEQKAEEILDRLLRKRALKLGKYGTQVTTTEGKPIGGKAIPATRTIELSSKTAPDIAHHEAMHVQLMDLAKSSDVRDRELVSKAFKETGKPEITAEEFVRLNEEEARLKAEGKHEEAAVVRERYIAAEEDIASFAGFEGAKRATQGGLKQWLKDFGSRFGVGETPAKQQLSARQEYEAPSGTRGELASGSTTEKFAERSPEVDAKIKAHLDKRPELRITNPKDGKSYAFSLDGVQDMSIVGGSPTERMITPKEENPWMPKFSTTVESSLKQKGAVIPDATSQVTNKESVPGEPQEGDIQRKEPEAKLGDSLLGKEEKPGLPEKMSEEESKYKVTKGIEDQLGEASFKAAKEAEKEQRNVREVSKAGLPIDEPIKDLEDSASKASFKAQEAEAFSRPDVERHSEQESIYTKDPNILPRKPIFSITTSVVDKIAEKNPKDYTHAKVTSKLRNYFNEADQKVGSYGQTLVREFSRYSPEEVNNVYKHRWEKDNMLSTERALTSKENKLNDAFQAIIERPKKDASEIGLLVKRGESFTKGGIKEEGYLPNQIDPTVLWKLKEEPNSIESKRSLRQWQEWIVKKGGSAQEAKELTENYLRAQREYGDSGGPEFNALRKAEGYGLPWELMDKNPARAAMRYGRRAANDISYFKHIQSDPEMLKALGLKDQFGENAKGDEKTDYIGSEKEVQNAMKFVWGKNVVDNPRFTSLLRLAGNLVMGHGTAIRNLTSIPGQMAPYDVRLKDIFNGLSNLSATRERAYETGSARVNPAEFEYLGELGNPDKVVARLDKMSDFLRKVQGRNLSDKLEGEVLYGIGEEWAKNMIVTGNITMLKRATGEAGYALPKGKPSQEDISKIAAGFVRLTRGSYGPQGLPNWALSGNIAPFVALNRFGIEKWNNVAKDVVEPMKKGNITPFLKYTLTSLGTGAIIEELNQLLSNRKSSDLNIAETMAAYAQTQDPELLSQKVIGLMQMASYAGIMGDFAKMASRAAAGKELSYSNPVGLPLYSLVTDTIGENLSAMIGAIRDGEDPINVMAQFIKSVPLQTIQAGRYLSGHLNEDTNRKEEFRDIRAYKEATGSATREELKASKPNPFENLESKKFKKTEDVGEAAAMLPKLFEDAFKRAGNDPYKLKAEFRKLKANSYQTMPSVEEQPTEFWGYLNYLRKSQGEEKASERVSKFFRMLELNKAKGSLVP